MPAKTKNTNKCTEKQPNCETNSINSRLGSYKPMNDGCSRLKQNPNPRGGSGGWLNSLRGGQGPLDKTLMGLSKIHGPKDQKEVTQHWDRFWTPSCLDDSHRLRMDLGLRPAPLERLSSWVSIHRKNIQFRIRKRLLQTAPGPRNRPEADLV